GDARLLGRTGPGADDDGLRLQAGHLLDGDAVVPVDRLGRPQLAQVLDQVVGEGVVVVDHDDHQSPSSAISSARIRARALFWASRYSAAGSESATMPAPAWMKTRSPCITMVRMAMHVSMAPPHEK